MVTILTILSLAMGLQTEDSIRLTIKQDTLVVDKSSPQISFSMTVENKFKDKFLMYSFKKLSEALDGDSFYCDGDISSGNSVFLYDSKGKQQYITISFNKGIYDEPVTEEDLRRNHERIKQQVVKDLIVLQPDSTTQYDQTFNLENFKLSLGEYDLYLIYYSGNLLFDMLGRSVIEEAQKRYSAQVFKGCIKSNTVKIIVE